MAKVVVWEVENRLTQVLVGEIRGRSVSVEASHVFALPQNSSPQGDAASLRQQLLALRLPARSEVIAVVGRQDVELKQFSLPPAPMEELPSLVQFQAQRELSLPEGAVLDYLPLAGDAQQSHVVLAAALAPKNKAWIEETIAGTGLKLARIALHGAAMSACVAQQQPEGCLLVEWRDAQVSFSARGEQGVCYLRSFKCSGTEELAQLTSELRRTLALLPGQCGIQPAQIVVACGAEQWAALQAQWKELSPVPLVSLDLKRFFTAQSRGVTTPGEGPSPIENPALVGALLEQADTRLRSLDFAHPRQVAAKPDHTFRYRMLTYAGLGAVAAVALWYTQAIQRLDGKLSAERNALAALKKSVKDFALDSARHERLAAWKQSDVTWLDELAVMAQRLPDATAAEVRTIDIRSGTANSQGAEVVVTGYAKDDGSVMAVEKSLRWEATRKLLSGRQLKLDQPFEGYSSDFQQSILIPAPLDSEAYKKALSEAVATASESKSSNPGVPGGEAAPAAVGPAAGTATAPPAAGVVQTASPAGAAVPAAQPAPTAATSTATAPPVVTPSTAAEADAKAAAEAQAKQQTQAAEQLKAAAAAAVQPPQTATFGAAPAGNAK